MKCLLLLLTLVALLVASSGDRLKEHRQAAALRAAEVRIEEAERRPSRAPRNYQHTRGYSELNEHPGLSPLQAILLREEQQGINRGDIKAADATAYTYTVPDRAAN